MKKNAILFSASNYTKSPLIQIDDLPGVKYDIQAMHKRLTQIGFEVKQIENISKNQIIPALEDNASHSPCDAIISYTLPGTADIITVIIIFIQLILHPSLRKAKILKHPQ